MKSPIRNKNLARSLGAVIITTLSASPLSACGEVPRYDAQIRSAFERESISLTSSQLSSVRESVRIASQDYCRYSPTGGNSKVRFAAVDLAGRLGLSAAVDRTLADRIGRVIQSLPCDAAPTLRCDRDISWNDYFRSTIDLNSNQDFLSLVNQKGFSPVKISWEDIGRYQNSAWGDRISDVGIWVRKNEFDASSSELALSVRRDNNFRDKVLMVPTQKIKIHVKEDGSTREVSLLERLGELGLQSKERDQNVIVSNQFAIVPVPSANMNAEGRSDTPPRAAFNFSIYPYGSTNYVITDVIEGSSDAIVGPGGHQMLFANVDGEKAPFTASRASDRPDLLALERDLKAQGMDVDVQRYYLVQIPLKKEAHGIELSSMGTPPMRRFYAPYPVAPLMEAPGSLNKMALGSAQDSASFEMEKKDSLALRQKAEGLTKVAIGHGESEGLYRVGSGFRGERAEEPIRVTVVYFVTPVGKVTKRDMDHFSQAFEAWDNQAIWGGSFVTKE